MAVYPRFAKVLDAAGKPVTVRKALALIHHALDEALPKVKNAGVRGLVEARSLESKRRAVRLLPPDVLPDEWHPSRDGRLTVWEMVHHLIRVLESGGESAAAALAAKLVARAQVARELAYRLYMISMRKNPVQEALRDNAVVQSWPELFRLARNSGRRRTEQMTMFGGDEA